MFLHVVFGPMYSGKTTELIRLIKRNIVAKKKVLVLKPDLDSRYSSEPFLNTHDGISSKCILTPADQKLCDLNDKYFEEYDVIVIDEGQFFNDINQYVVKASFFDVTIIIACLICTYDIKQFKSNTINLIPIADEITHLKAICMKCMSENGIFSYRVDKSNDEAILIGSTDTYMTLCRECYLTN